MCMCAHVLHTHVHTYTHTDNHVTELGSNIELTHLTAYCHSLLTFEGGGDLRANIFQRKIDVTITLTKFLNLVKFKILVKF